MKTFTVIALFILIVTLTILMPNKYEDIRYLQTDQIFQVILSGEMDECLLIKRVEALKISFKQHLKSDMPIKLLVDFRGVKWDSEKTHYKTRAIFAEHLKEYDNYSSFSALLNDQYDFQSSGHEAFFTKESDALNWLRKQSLTNGAEPNETIN